MREDDEESGPGYGQGDENIEDDETLSPDELEPDEQS